MSGAKTVEPIETYFGEHTPWVVHCHVMSVSTCGRDKGGGGWVQAASWCPDIPPPVTVLEKEFTIQTLAAMALAVYTVIESRSKQCATEVKS